MGGTQGSDDEDDCSDAGEAIPSLSADDPGDSPRLLGRNSERRPSDEAPQESPDIGDADKTGLDPETPTVWMAGRGFVYILLVAGSWELRTFNPRWLASEYVVIDNDPSKDLRAWLNEAWPRIAGDVGQCMIETTNSGRSNDDLITKMLAAPWFESEAGGHDWGRWNADLADSIRAAELESEEEWARGRDQIATASDPRREAKDEARIKF